ncbi:MAG: ribosomal protein S18 acetylase RimI-like enzyme [Saprospiraceae bacterium]|jgi:ribosomal protein S18 acetylase RimI-like enzyme|tara:strand:+ start:3565 stop:4050 length:486 start_codon:yes stop_codon:yes gene_type:complete
MKLELIRADYQNEQQSKDLLMLLNSYAIDPMGGGEELSDYVKSNLIQSMASRQDIFTILCYVNNEPAGLINCIEGFSTFSAKPLMNIHDVTVKPKFRGLGLSEKMFSEVEKLAQEKGCCKLTLEVLEGNEIAKNAYTKFGYSGYELEPEMGKAIFWQKKLK